MRKLIAPAPTSAITATQAPTDYDHDDYRCQNGKAPSDTACSGARDTSSVIGSLRFIEIIGMQTSSDELRGESGANLFRRRGTLPFSFISTSPRDEP
jgi:hypothetical protein